MEKHETIILRFRDLVTSANGTVNEHKSVIDTYGEVWWAWWKKGDEKTPEQFPLLGALAKETPINVFLVDSGQNLLYKAVCIGIESRTVDPILSPEKEKTPVYYRDVEYYAWFRFRSIESCDITELNHYSYVDSNALFDDPNIDYSRFDNKRIHSVEELIQQNRTVWFVRQAKDTDPDNEIVLLNTDRIQPTDFSKKYCQTTGNTLLWLSDLHLPDHAFEQGTGKIHATVAQHIRDCIKDAKISGLLISGDITSYAKEEGFLSAQQLLKDIDHELSASLNSENILICPGNHDLKMDLSTLKKKQEPEFIYKREDTTAGYAGLYKSIYHLQPNKFLACGKKIMLETGHLLEIASLNSLVLQQYRNFEGHGYLSQEQLEFVATQMGWKDDRNQKAIRIAMMHHHYLPTCYTEAIDATRSSSAVYDADRFMNWLVKYHVQILLHGHKHKSFFSEIFYPKAAENTNIDTAHGMEHVAIVGMGSTGAKGVENKFATICFDHDAAKITFYKIYPGEYEKDIKCQEINIGLR